MIIVLLGASGSGKSTIEIKLSSHHGHHKIISYTTRQPRQGEVNGKDYYFITNEQFDEMVKMGLFAETEEYSQGRKYGTLISDYVDTTVNKVVVLTPNGLKQLKKNTSMNEIYVVLVESSLGNRIKRYIDRVGAENFTYDDKNEIMSRVDRDYGMFLGMKNEANIVVTNNGENGISDSIDRIKDFINIW